MTLLGNLFGQLFGDSASEFEARGDQFAAVNNWRRAFEEYDRALQKTSRSAPGFRRLAAKLEEARLQSFDSLIEDIHSRIDMREFTYAAEQIGTAREMAESRDQLDRLTECEERLRGTRRYEPRPRAARSQPAAAVDPAPWREDPAMESGTGAKTPSPAAEIQRRFRTLLDGAPQEVVEERVALGTSYQEGTLALAEGRAEEAVRIFAAALDAKPQSPILVYDLGVALQAAGRHSEAVELYRRRISQEPADWQAWFEMALALWQRRTREEALRVVEEGLERHPRCGHLMSQWGVFLHKLGRRREALEKFYLALQLDAFDDPGLYHTIANLHRELGDAEKARRGYLKALELEPRSVGTQLDYAEFLLEEKQDARAALAILDTAFRVIRGAGARPLYRVYASYLSSRAHMLLGEREMALLAVTRALEDNDQDWLTATLEQQRQAVLSV
ncbi:MAG: tetratricopeptide repeat protein [Candidatus Latescibacterota bacterium]|nr:MAG: tetratricopeptide repeat protein [Candidatus Latescibacterota bacterium]